MMGLSEQAAPLPDIKLEGYEYLFTEEEKAAWEKMDPTDRPHNFVPQAFNAYRHVPLYNNLLKERFDRCLDLTPPRFIIIEC